MAQQRNAESAADQRHNNLTLDELLGMSSNADARSKALEEAFRLLADPAYCAECANELEWYLSCWEQAPEGWREQAWPYLCDMHARVVRGMVEPEYASYIRADLLHYQGKQAALRKRVKEGQKYLTKKDLTTEQREAGLRLLRKLTDEAAALDAILARLNQHLTWATTPLDLIYDNTKQQQARTADRHRSSQSKDRHRFA